MRRKDREVTEENIIHEVFSRADVCRLGFADKAIPYIVAMNFGVQFARPIKIYFHSAPKGRKIDLMIASIESNSPICFQIDIDHVLRPADITCDSSMNYKSILGYGKLKFLDNEQDKQNALNCIMNHYMGSDVRGANAQTPIPDPSGMHGDNVTKKYTYSEKDLKAVSVIELTVESLSCKMREL